MDGDMIHKADEFGSLPWATLDPGEFGKTWSMGRGGHGFSDWTYTVSIYHDGSGMDLWADIYEVPAPLGEAIRVIRENAKGETRKEIHRALGL